MLIVKVVGGSASERDLTELVRYAYQIAHLRLRQLLHSGRLHLHSYSISLEGVAFDSIADLFRRDEQGQFVELSRAFSCEWSGDRIDDDTCAYRLRSLIFGAIQEGIARLYREYDPIFSKILRNVRLALKRSSSYRVFERLGLQYASAVPEEDMAAQLPELSVDELERLLTSRLRRTPSVPNILSDLFAVLDKQQSYRKFYGVLDIALVIKRIMVRERILVSAVVQDESALLGQDIEMILTRSLDDLRSEFRTEYVDKGKIPAVVLEKYFQAITLLIEDVFARNDGEAWAQPDYLAEFMPGMTRDEYRRNHRMHFEYMVRVARKRIGDQLKELL